MLAGLIDRQPADANAVLAGVILDQRHILDDLDGKAVRKVVICSGKVYYDLLSKRREEGIEDIAIVRVEQLYPFPYTYLGEALAEFPNAEAYVWCQEEPRNQGAWFNIKH
ncbi:MAG: hypothetical protein ACOC9J_03950, partial [Persicimonas sp.]